MNVQGFVDQAIKLAEVDPEQARAMFASVLSAEPSNIHALNGLGGLTLYPRQQYHAAEAYLRRAVAYCDDVKKRGLISGNLGNCLFHLQRPIEALLVLDRAIAEAPGVMTLHSTRGLTLYGMRRYEEAVLEFEEALRLDVHKHRHDALTNDACMSRLAAGRPGYWEAYEARFNFYRKPPIWASGVPRWGGEDIEGKRIFIHQEQGYGDVIQFVRLLPALKAVCKPAELIFGCPVELQRLLCDGDTWNIDGIDDIVHTDAIPPVDVFAPLMDLPKRLGVPCRPELDPGIATPFDHDWKWTMAGYIRPPATGPQLPRWKPTEGALKVGVCWAANQLHGNEYGRLKSLDLRQLLAVAALPDLALFSLQQIPYNRDIQNFGAEGLITDLAPLLTDWASTAHILKQLDLVITVCTGVAHLSAAMGIPTWIMVPFNSCWRWGTARRVSEWYPSVRLFRQARAGYDWEWTIEEIVNRLRVSPGENARAALQSEQALENWL